MIAEQTAALVTRDLTIGYKRANHTVAAHLDLTLKDGELVCLIGQNGVGKTTLLRTLAGMQPPLSGQVLLRGQNIHQLDVSALARLLSIVLTDRSDPGVIIARELVALGRHPHTDWLGRLTRNDHAIIDDVIRVVGAEHLAERPVRELSDGERQKIMIARALAQEPALLMLDEPTAFLDLPRRVEMMRLLRRLTQERGMAALISTHDLDLALRAADRLWLMSSGGTLIAGAPEDLVLSGAFTAAFDSRDVQFDAETGSFRIGVESGGTVSLIGADDLRTVWTRRALERAGYRVVTDSQSTDARIEIEGQGWRVHINGSATDADTLYHLIAILRYAIH